MRMLRLPPVVWLRPPEGWDPAGTVVCALLRWRCGFRPPARLGRVRLVAVVLGVVVAAGMAHVPGASAYVYWANYDSTTIARANLDGLGANEMFMTVPKETDGVAVDGAHIYWANYGANAIGRANLDGSGANPNFITNGVSGPAGVAVNRTYLYFANTNSGAIARVNINGSGPVNTGFIPGGNYPGGVALDGAHVYWTNQGDDTIGRANLNGTEVKQNFITGAHTPYGVAVDRSHIYWTNFGSTTLGRANLDGTGVDQVFIAGADRPAGVAVDATHIYWANFGMGTNGTIGRANLDGGGERVDFITGARGPAGVALNRLPLTPQPPSPPSPPAPIAPATLATITGLNETNRVFTVGRTSTALTGHTAATRHKRGTVFLFRLDQPASMKVVIQRLDRGRRVGRVCRPDTRALRSRPRCTRAVRVTTLTRTARILLNKLPFTGRIRGRALKPARYRAIFTAIDAAGASRPRALIFTIVTR